IVFFVLGSCTPHRQLVYLQDKMDQGNDLPVNIDDYILKPNDILHIRVSTLDEDAHSLFNMEDLRTMRTTSTTGLGDLNLYIYGYSITEEGKIQMPVVGEIEVGGLSIDEARATIQEKVEEYLIGATISVKLVNFSVTVLGEVRRPGNYYIFDNGFTIMDAIGLAGDLTDYGNRNINIVRRTADGVKFATLDITDRSAVTSDYFYLQPNDLVYVEPHTVKRLGFAQFPFAVLFSAISTTLLLINFIQ
ncbi:MAG: polysaccharide biosynthesis/export family protein, partial [Bacteroidales bacterium]